MKFKIAHIMVLVAIIALGVGWYAERQRHARNKLMWMNERQQMLDQFQRESLVLVDGLMTLESISSFQNRANWHQGRLEPRPVNDDELCSLLVCTWKYREGLSVALNVKTGSLNETFPNPKISMDSDDRFALSLARQVLETAQIDNADQFAEMLVNSKPFTLGFAFDNSNRETADFKSLMEFIEKAFNKR